MFWKFGFHSSSPIDSLLEKNNITLAEILEQDRVLQEVKGSNEKLLNFLVKSQNLQELLSLLLKKNESSSLVMEILSCDIDVFYSALLQNLHLLREFWDVLDGKMDDVNASYFSRLNIILLQKRPREVFNIQFKKKMVDFIKSIENVVQKMLKHLQTTAITDIIMKLVSLEDVRAGVVDVKF